MRFRQVHLDFHTSEKLTGIGEAFDKKQWQETLKKAAVDSITIFGTCHHGRAYYETEVGEKHPGLKFDLLRAQLDACHEIGVNAPVYISAGFSEWIVQKHPDWIICPPDGAFYLPLRPYYKKLCFNTPWLDILCAQIREVVTKYPDADGIFLDIIGQGQCCCRYCLEGMEKAGLDAANEADRITFAKQVLMNYYKKTTEAARINRPDMPIFHNSGHVSVGSGEIMPYFSHLELESLPTGGWGYDHYPFSAAYVRNLNKEFLGMTGKFHTTWGEFGGFKAPEALRYECAAMIANGSKCSIGDQLHPGAKLDEGTYEIIGQAYREVREKEAWCDNVKSCATVAILSEITPYSHTTERELPGDTGASRILLEAHIPFDVVDTEMDWSKYKALILADDVLLDDAVKAKLEAFVKAGGKLILSGKSGMDVDHKAFQLDDALLPFTDSGVDGKFEPDYIKAAADFVPRKIETPFVMYEISRRIKAKDGAESLGEIYEPYFQRRFDHFSSHQHTPYKPEGSGFDAGAMNENVLYFAHPVFSIYRGCGTVILKEFVVKAIRKFLGDIIPVETDLPSQGRVTLMEQEAENRYVLHLLYANTILRGGTFNRANGKSYGYAKMEVIDELNPIGPVSVKVRVPKAVNSVKLVPAGDAIDFTTEADGSISFTVPQFTCHSMIELA